MICTLSFRHFTKNRDLKTDALLYKLRSIGVNNYYNFYFLFFLATFNMTHQNMWNNVHKAKQPDSNMSCTQDLLALAHF